LINSCQRYFSCGPSYEGQALFRSYGCFFAEFLGDLSLVRLGLLDLITCVGLRYGFYIHKLRNFSWKRALSHLLSYPNIFASLEVAIEGRLADLPTNPSYDTNTNPIMCGTYYTPSFHRCIQKSWNINHVAIGCGFLHYLRTD